MTARTAYPPGLGRAGALVAAAHPGPTVVVTTIAGLLAIGSGMPGTRVLLVCLAVLTGQLSIGWSNDLLDAERDRAAGRRDKPLAAGRVSPRLVRGACLTATVATVPLSVLCGAAAGVVHLLVVGSGWAYNLRLKATVWSWLPYAVAFGALPAFVALTAGTTPRVGVVAAGAMLGVGAHLLNVLPDLDDDAATGVKGLPHRLPRRLLAPAGLAVLATASIVLLGVTEPSGWVAAITLVVVGALVAVGLVGSGRTPFRAGMALAVLDVALLAGAW